MKIQEIVKVQGVDIKRLDESTEMIQLTDLFEVENFVIEEGDDQYELVDFFCKNENCDCTNVKFRFILNGEDTNEVLLYDYEKRQVSEPSKYAFLLDQFKDLEVFNDTLKYKHEVVKGEFEIFRLKNEKKALEEEIKQLKKGSYEKNPSQKTVRKDNKIGRNDPCLCGSGKKYKRCCLKS